MDEKLKHEIESLEINDYDGIIKLYESNMLYLSNFERQSDKESLKIIAGFTISYIYSLDQKNHNTKAYHYLRNADVLLQKIKHTEEYDELYDSYLFAYAVTSYKLKKHEEAKEYFSQLVKKDPDNDMYKTWNDSNDDYLFAKKSNIFGYLGFAMIMFGIFGEYLIEINYDVTKFITFLGFFLMISGFYSYKIRRLLKRIKIVYK